MSQTVDFDDISLEIRGLGKGRFETRFKANGQGEATGPFALQRDVRRLFDRSHSGSNDATPWPAVGIARICIEGLRPDLILVYGVGPEVVGIALIGIEGLRLFDGAPIDVGFPHSELPDLY